MTPHYTVDYHCHCCNQTHPVSLDFRPEYGPTRAGTVADLFPAGDLPPSLRNKLRNLIWCPKVGDYVRMDHPHEFYSYEGLKHYFSTSADNETTQQMFQDSLSCLQRWLEGE